MNKEQYLKQLALELHKPAFKKYKTARVIVSSKNDIWSADLMDMGVKNSQSIYRYILVVVDAWTKYVWVGLAKDKKADTILELLKEILATGNVPRRLWVDQGSEFINDKVQNHLDIYGIETYHTYSKNKSVYAERFIRTLKDRLYRWMTEHNTEKWTKEAVNNIVKEYNNTPHTTTKIKPIDLLNNKDPQVDIDLYNKLASKYNNDDDSKQKFYKDDWVRISLVKGPLEKSAEQNWSNETYQISDVIKTNGIYIYKIKDYTDKIIEGTFYTQELQKSLLEDTYLVEKVLKHRTYKNIKQSQVIYVGFPKEVHWINDSDIKDLI